MSRRTVLVMLLLGGLLAAYRPAPAQACGGLFCTTSPVDQAAERIIFAVNEDQGTIDAYVQINYTGSAESFAWVVPVPNPPKLDVAEMEIFDELDRLTAPQYIAPPLPSDCPVPAMAGSADNAAESGVIIHGQGSVGPYDYAIVGSEDPQELVRWLRDNGYRITEQMEPLVDVYVEEQMVFLAMKLQADKGVQDIQPVKMTYQSRQPMIPLRLTAVAANPDMRVITWVLAKTQVEPANYEVMRIREEDVVFRLFGGHNYETLVSETADRLGGRAFATEYAAPAARLAIRATNADLQRLLSNYAYLTRVYTRISPEEMTIDPVFNFNADLPDVSNIHDLSDREWDCDAGATLPVGYVDDGPARDSDRTDAEEQAAPTPTASNTRRLGWGTPLAVAGAVGGLLALGFIAGRRVTKRRG